VISVAFALNKNKVNRNALIARIFTRRRAAYIGQIFFMARFHTPGNTQKMRILTVSLQGKQIYIFGRDPGDLRQVRELQRVVHLKKL